MNKRKKGGQARRLPPTGRNTCCLAPCWHMATGCRHWATAFTARLPQNSGFCWPAWNCLKRRPRWGELGGAMADSHQNTKQLALKLAAKQYVRLVRDEVDARRTRVVPGPACTALREHYREKQETFMQRCLRACRRQTWLRR